MLGFACRSGGPPLGPPRIALHSFQEGHSLLGFPETHLELLQGLEILGESPEAGPVAVSILVLEELLFDMSGRTLGAEGSREGL